MFNILTNKVLPQRSTERFLDVQKVEEERYESFVKERIEGDSSIWDTIKKEKLPTFTDNYKVTSVKVNGETLHIKEERKLMNRILIASRSRPEIDLPNIFGKYEFSVSPLSLFAPNGSLYYAKDKSSIATELREFQPDENYIEEEANSESRKVIIFDVMAMAIVNKIDIKAESLENCDEFASKFCEIINFQGRGFDKVRIIFDRYDGKSLKSNTRVGRNKGAVPFTTRSQIPLELVTWKRSNFLLQWQQRRSSLLILHEDWLVI